MEDPYIYNLLFDRLPISDWGELASSNQLARKVFQDRVGPIIANSEFRNWNSKYFLELYEILIARQKLANDLDPLFFESFLENPQPNFQNLKNRSPPENSNFVSVSALSNEDALFLENTGKVYLFSFPNNWRLLLESAVQIKGNLILLSNGTVQEISDQGELIPEKVDYPVSQLISSYYLPRYIGRNGEIDFKNHQYTVPGAINAKLTKFSKHLIVHRSNGTLIAFDVQTHQTVAQDLTGDILQISSYQYLRGLTVSGKIVEFKIKDGKIIRKNFPVPQNIGRISKIIGNIVINLQGIAYRSWGYWGTAALNWEIIRPDVQVHDISPGIARRTEALDFFAIGKRINDYFEDARQGSVVINEQEFPLDVDIYGNSLISYRLIDPGNSGEFNRLAWVYQNETGIYPPAENHKGMDARRFGPGTQNIVTEAVRSGTLYRKGELDNNINLFYFVNANHQIRILIGIEGDSEIYPILKGTDIPEYVL